MHHVFRAARWLLARLSAVLVLAAVAGRLVRWWRGRRSDGRAQREIERASLPSLYEVHPGATTAPRRPLGLKGVPLDRIVGTTRRPTQNTADFLPLPRLRGTNWRARWQRINRAVDRLAPLPPVDLLQVGDAYWVVDGHNRIAAARRAGALEIDADVTQLVLPGVAGREHGRIDPTSLVGGEELRQAGTGRHSRTVEQRPAADAVSRQDLLRELEGPE